jgi:hypothetical protein
MRTDSEAVARGLVHKEGIMSGIELKVLSVRQPWASLLLSGEDWCENRSWDTKHRGPLWIHASSKIEKAECEAFGIDVRRLVSGAIIGVVEVVDVFHIDELEERLPAIDRKYHLNDEVGPEFVCGEYCWIVANPRALKTPIPAKGKLNLWRYQADAGAVSEFVPMSPLITRIPEHDDDDDDNDDCETNFILEYDDGTSESVTYFIKPGTDGPLMVRFNDTDEVFRLAGSEEPAYLQGSERFQFACEVAWDRFEEFFGPDDD